MNVRASYFAHPTDPTLFVVEVMIAGRTSRSVVSNSTARQALVGNGRLRPANELVPPL